MFSITGKTLHVLHLAQPEAHLQPPYAETEPSADAFLSPCLKVASAQQVKGYQIHFQRNGAECRPAVSLKNSKSASGGVVLACGC